MRTSVRHGLSSASDMSLGLGTLSDSLQSCRCTTLAALVSISLPIAQEDSEAFHGFDQELGQVARTQPHPLVQKDRVQASSCFLGMQDFG